MALHTAARKYCQEEFSRWSDSYAALEREKRGKIHSTGRSGWDYSEEAYKMFPRYRIAEAILDEIEKIIPSSVGSLEQLAELLIRAAQDPEKQLATQLRNPHALAALTAEANDYREYIGKLRTLDLNGVEPLPYHRVLNPEESKLLWERLARRWDLGGDFWFPLRQGDPPPNAIAFHEELFSVRHGAEMLREGLIKHAIDHVFQLYACRPPSYDYELELSIFEPACTNGDEQYFTSKDVDWLLYTSHESSITIAGDWLADYFKEKWPDWSERTYQGPFSTSDLRGTWETNELW